MSTNPTGSEQRFDLRDAFENKSIQLAATMATAPLVTSHGPTIGDASEQGWRTMLEGFLPTRYGVSKAFVVDSDGGTSHQLDVVIHDRHFTPLFFKIDGALFLPAESVYAVFEVKQQLSLDHVAAAGKKVASVRGLRRTSQRIVHAGGEIFEPKPAPRILGGILARRSNWNPPFGEPLKSALDSLEDSQRLDLGCGLQHGAFELPHGAATAADIAVAGAAVGLAFFAMRLMARLQRMGTVPALDIDAYTAKLPEEQGDERKQGIVR